MQSSSEVHIEVVTEINTNIEDMICFFNVCVDLDFQNPSPHPCPVFYHFLPKKEQPCPEVRKLASPSQVAALFTGSPFHRTKT
ncbi:hypothetical protein VNO80_26808 [Phaseolus coccineus]|uniref:Uncharacterized protein n=1 Tax=Phaseolus coccineus TaxID=3886 RepID=A0AAN9LJ64_PHACN